MSLKMTPKEAYCRSTRYFKYFVCCKQTVDEKFFRLRNKNRFNFGVIGNYCLN